VFTFTFDGSAIADVFVTLNEEPAATCDVNLESFEATCTGV
jgi:hypothetical protein